MEKSAVRMRAALTVLLALAACRTSSPAARPHARASTNARDPALESRAVYATSNPILADSAHYTTDPAPLLANGKLYILTGRDMAKRGENDFVMPEWQMLETNGDPMSGAWTHYPHFLKPDDVFKWAAPGRAYAAQIVRAASGRFFLYAPVVQAASTNKDHFAIGVAVAVSRLGRGWMRIRRVRWCHSRIRWPTISRTSTLPCWLMTTGASISTGEHSAT